MTPQVVCMRTQHNSSRSHMPVWGTHLSSIVIKPALFLKSNVCHLYGAL